MSKSKPIKLSNGRSWPTQAAAKEHFKQMLNRYEENAVIDDEQDVKDLSALVERYDSLISGGPSKIGVGIDHFECRLNKDKDRGWRTRGFWIVRKDGTSTDFSYIKAIEGRPKSDVEEFKDACFNAISSDLIDMKRKQFDSIADVNGRIPCDITSELISFDEAEIRHANPRFEEIVRKFRKLKHWEDNIPPGTLTPPDDAQTTTHFTDNAIGLEFLKFHHERAVLWIVGKNRPSLKRTERVTPKRPLRFS